jgi:uncharacterized protein involved in outer membrane biogenesis
MQRLMTRLFQAFACLTLATLLTATVSAADASGTWTWTMPAQGDRPERTSTLKLKVDGDKVTGTINGRPNQDDIKISDGKISGDDITFSVTREFNGNSRTQKFAGKLSGDTIKGKITGTGRDGGETSREWVAKRKADK